MLLHVLVSVAFRKTNKNNKEGRKYTAVVYNYPWIGVKSGRTTADHYIYTEVCRMNSAFVSSFQQKIGFLQSGHVLSVKLFVFASYQQKKKKILTTSTINIVGLRTKKRHVMLSAHTFVLRFYQQKRGYLLVVLRSITILSVSVPKRGMYCFVRWYFRGFFISKKTGGGGDPKMSGFTRQKQIGIKCPLNVSFLHLINKKTNWPQRYRRPTTPVYQKRPWTARQSFRPCSWPANKQKKGVTTTSSSVYRRLTKRGVYRVR